MPLLSVCGLCILYASAVCNASDGENVVRWWWWWLEIWPRSSGRFWFRSDSFVVALVGPRSSARVVYPVSGFVRALFFCLVDFSF